MPARRPPSLLERLARSPHQFDPLEALRHLERRDGAAGQPRIRGAVTNRHIATPVVQVREDGEGSSEIEVGFLGMAGSLGALPPPYTEAALLARKRHSHSLAAFLDMFVHRFTQLFARAAEKYRLPAQVARERAQGPDVRGDRIAGVLLALIGLALPALRGRLSIADGELLPYAGLLGNQTRSAAGLEAMLADLFRLPVRIAPFSGHWMAIGPSEQTRLNALTPQYVRLGVDAIAGERLWDVQGTFRVIVGPLDYAAFLSLAPQGARMRRLVDAVRFYAGPDLRFDIELVLAKEAIPACQLEGTNVVLGWNAWLKLLPSTRDSHDAVHSPQA